MKKQILLILLTLLINSAFAAYLKNVPLELTQPDGTIIHCFVTGDEFHRRVHDENNYTIVQDPVTGFYVYAEIEDNQLVPTSYIAGKIDPAGTPLEPGYDVLPSEMEATRRNALKSASAVAANPTTGEFNNIVIAIRFADQDATTLSADYLYTLLNSVNDLSLRYYFREVSNNQLDVYSHIFPEPEKDRLFEYRDSHPRNYYLPYHETENPEGYQGAEGMQRDQVLLKQALEFFNDEIVSSGINFDMNDDGVIDNILFIIQGDIDSWGNVLWPQAFSLNNFMVGNKRAGRINKNFTGRLTTGLLCHEFFHSLGAPDLYRYTNRDFQPVGSWDIMGSDNTQHTTTYMKWRYGKWFDDIPEITAPGTYTLEPVSQNPFACYKIPSPVGSGEYFMLEYRRKEGLPENSLPWDYEEGLIIYRINPDVLHGNSGGPPDEVFVFRPDGSEFDTGKIHLAAFSANNSRSDFNNETNPKGVFSNGEPGWIHISEVSWAGDEITFKFNKINPLPVPARFEATKGNGEIEFTWEAPSTGNYSLEGYNIYEEGNDEPLNSSLITGTSYNHNFTGQEPYYIFNLVALYGEGESDPVSAILLNSGDSFLSDSLALVMLYNQCGGPFWLQNDNWLKGPLHTWYGVTVEDKRVTALNLPGSWHERFGLINALPEELGVLSALRNLNLSYNALEGEILQSLYNLKELRVLDLTDNQITGHLSGLPGKLLNLELLLLADNLLSGDIPADISSLVNLEKLNLSGNSFTGTIMAGVSSLTRLQYLELENNHFTGTVPPGTGELKNLVELDLSGNRFSGSLPDELENLTELMYLKLDNNLFQGAVPPGINKIPRLREISLANNGFDAFPAMTYTANLAIIAMDGNRFTFEDIEPNMDIEFARGYLGLTYKEQAKTGKAETKYAQPGKPFTLSVYCGGKNNLYQWFRDGEAVSEVSGSPEYVVENVADGNNGDWHCQVTNTTVYGLTIESHPVTLIGKVALVADAGNDFGAAEGSVVTLNGTRSYGPGNTSLSYQWTAPEGIELTGTGEAQPTFTAPRADYDRAYAFTLVVSEGNEDSAPDEVVVTIRDAGDVPVADAGHGQTVEERELVILDGSGSSAPGGGDIAYRWTSPESIDLTGEDEAKPSFTAPEVDSDTEFIFTLVVTSGGVVSAPDTVVITVQNLRQAPVADAGPGQTVNEGELVTLDGSGSFVPGGGGLTFRWTAPVGIELTGADEAKPTFTAPAVTSDTLLVFTLEVTGEGEDSARDEVTVTVRNIPQPPMADAGPGQTVRAGETVTLDGTGSVNPEAGSLSYNWHAPQGIVLEGPDEPACTFTAPLFDIDTTIMIYLVVTNPYGQSDTAGVEITIRHAVTVSVDPDRPVHFDVYPNPSGGIVNIRLNHSETGSNVRLSVTASTGELIMEKQVHSSGHFSIDLSEQPAGVYLIRLIHAGQIYHRKQMLK